MTKITRTELRQNIMTILYQIFLYENNHMDYNLDDIYKEVDLNNDEFVKLITNGVLEKRDTIDAFVNKYLVSWPINRLGLADQAILRMSIYELLYTETPAIVVINEAIELAKQYSDDNIRKMINSVLDKIYHDLDK